MTNKEIMNECVEEAVEVLRDHMPEGTNFLTQEESLLACLLYMEKRK